jgi:hypothetical protein
MSEIGLPFHYSYYDGSDCRWRRKRATELLPDVIWNHAESREVVGGLMHLVGIRNRDFLITPPIGVLIALAQSAAEYADTSDYSLTVTWQVCADVIQAHIHEAYASDKTSGSYINACIDHWASAVTPRGNQWMDPLLRGSTNLVF